MVIRWCEKSPAPPPPPPLRGRRDRMRVPKISGKGVFSRDEVRPENCKISFKRGCFFSLFGLLRILKRGL